MKMPDKTSGLLAMLIEWVTLHQPALYGFSLSLVTAWLRVMYSGGTHRQRVLEAAMCGAISLSLMSAMEWIGVPLSASGFIGGMVGFLGVEKIRALATVVITKKVGSDGENQ